MFRETEARPWAGLPALLLLILATLITIWGFVLSVRSQSVTWVVTSVIIFIITSILYAGLFIVNPGDAKALILWGSYKGTVKTAGFWYANPFLTRRRISLRVRNFETAKLKVNDNRANPIEIAAIVVWKVVETAEALFEVDNYEKYVTVQSESAVRAVAQSYAYDSHAPDEHSLSTHTAEVSKSLQQAIQERLSKAGVDVVEARISHLAYAPEIAQAMLRRQQATAIIAARFKIVEGAVGMVENALELLSHKGIVHLDEERKAAMVSNLLVVLCSERDASPIVNAGSIYT
ncbi:MAG TPA: SPFH domain-containing protein [Gemmatimonadaceae bacterium]|nr:SPFH domain-containing protein [Gemmatimonadaceae bacterium]